MDVKRIERDLIDPQAPPPGKFNNGVVRASWGEMAAIGLHRGLHTNTWGEKLNPQLIKKGVPAEKLVIGGFDVWHRFDGDGIEVRW